MNTCITMKNVLQIVLEYPCDFTFTGVDVYCNHNFQRRASWRSADALVRIGEILVRLYESFLLNTEKMNEKEPYCTIYSVGARQRLALYALRDNPQSLSEDKS